MLDQSYYAKTDETHRALRTQTGITDSDYADIQAE